MTKKDLEAIKPKLLNESLELIDKGEKLKKRYVDAGKTRPMKLLQDMDDFEISVQDYIDVRASALCVVFNRGADFLLTKDTGIRKNK